MDFDKAISQNAETLIGIVAALFAMLGLAGAGGVEDPATQSIPKQLRAAVLRILRPAEAAVRRLIFVSARGMVLKPTPSRPMPAGGIPSRRTGVSSNRPPSFKLDDPCVPMVSAVTSAGDPLVRPSVRHQFGGQLYSLGRSGPRISTVLPIDPTVPGVLAARASGPNHAQTTTLAVDRIKSAHLIRRLHAIRAALQNLPRQAKRLARWTARRERRAMQHPVYTSPLRPGRPPGYRQKPEHEIEIVLHKCHWLVFEASLNTS